MYPPPSALHVKAALAALQSDGVVACPTEAVWGLSCDPQSQIAVSRLLALKNRPEHKGLILVAAATSQLDFLLHDISADQRQRLEASWPGPATWLVPHHERVPPWVRGDHPTVAVRVSAHPVVRLLCQQFGGPVISTSANPAGARPAMAVFQLRRYFGSQLDCVLPGPLGGASQPSRITDLQTGRVMRA